jgi:hypothetical protein
MPPPDDRDHAGTIGAGSIPVIGGWQGRRVAVENDRMVGRLALATGIVTVVSLVALVLFFALGQGNAFGTINDWTIGAIGVLTIALALAVRRDTISWIAIVGGAIVLIGALLVISRTTGFLLAGLIESVGFALVGLWLIAINRAADRRWPRQLGALGVLAGGVMAIGFVVLPGVAQRLDDMATAPWWVWIGFVGWLGIFVLYPAWSLWLGRELTSR